MKKNIRDIKRELRNFSKKRLARNFSDDSEGDTFDAKIAVIRKNLYGDCVAAFEDWETEDIVRFFEDTASESYGEASQVWEHIANVLSYMNGETEDRPVSLAVASACKELQKHCYDYSSAIEYNLEECIKNTLADYDANQLVDVLEKDEDSLSEWCIEEFVNKLMDSDWACTYNWCDYNGNTEKFALQCLAGNIEALKNVYNWLGEDDMDPVHADTSIRDYYLGELCVPLLKKKLAEYKGHIGDLKNPFRKGTFSHTIMSGDVNAVKEFIDKGSVENIDTAPYIPIALGLAFPVLHWKTYSMRDKNKAKAVIQALIDAGADIDIEDTSNENAHGNNALMHAVEKGDLDMVKFLVNKGADVDYYNDISYKNIFETALTCDKRNEDIIRFLLRKGARVQSSNVQNIQGFVRGIRNEELENEIYKKHHWNYRPFYY